MSRKMIDYNINDDGYIDKIDGRELKGIDQDTPAGLTVKTIKAETTRLPVGDYVEGKYYTVKVWYEASDLPSAAQPFIYSGTQVLLNYISSPDSDEPLFISQGPTSTPTKSNIAPEFKLLCIRSGTLTTSNVNHHSIKTELIFLLSE